MCSCLWLRSVFLQGRWHLPTSAHTETQSRQLHTALQLQHKGLSLRDGGSHAAPEHGTLQNCGIITLQSCHGQTPPIQMKHPWCQLQKHTQHLVTLSKHLEPALNWAKSSALNTTGDRLYLWWVLWVANKNTWAALSMQWGSSWAFSALIFYNVNGFILRNVPAMQ